MERYIAIDNVCAWPNLTQMPDGAIVATIFNQPCHGQWEGDVECWGSEDGGRTWRLRGTAAPHEPGTNRMNVAAGLAHNGDLVILASGWNHRPVKGQVSGFGHPARRLPPWVCRSADGGRTWTIDKSPNAVRLPFGMDREDGDSLLFKPIGDIVQVPGGRLTASFYHDGGSVWMLFSNDDGRTWTESAVISNHHRGETAILRLPSGHWLAAARTEGEVGGFTPDVGMQLFVSTDEGRNWIDAGTLTGPSEHPGHLCALQDGRVLLVYGRRGNDPAFLGLGYRLSSDGGQTWTAPACLLESGHTPGMVRRDSDGGYPSSVQLADGSMVTAYYSSCMPHYHDRYHMGVTIWKPEERQ